VLAELVPPDWPIPGAAVTPRIACSVENGSEGVTVPGTFRPCPEDELVVGLLVPGFLPPEPEPRCGGGGGGAVSAAGGVPEPVAFGLERKPSTGWNPVGPMRTMEPAALLPSNETCWRLKLAKTPWPELREFNRAGLVTVN
jgi:hypothetical protein